MSALYLAIAAGMGLLDVREEARPGASEEREGDNDSAPTRTSSPDSAGKENERAGAPGTLAENRCQRCEAVYSQGVRYSSGILYQVFQVCFSEGLG